MQSYSTSQGHCVLVVCYPDMSFRTTCLNGCQRWWNRGPPLYEQCSHFITLETMISIAKESVSLSLDSDANKRVPVLNAMRLIIAPILTKYYNVSIETQSVISYWKLSKVTPIYKGKGSNDDAGNYRHISLIGHIMKIFEKEIKLQVIGYLEVNNLITSDQSAYSTGANSHRRPNKENRSTYLTEKV